MTRKTPDVGAAMLQPGRKARAGGPAEPAPVAMPVIPMVLTLDQLAPNPDNPRLIRNSCYNDIKASIRASGLDSVPIVTRNPDAPEKYIFSNGGNTRYQILNELWEETGDERFWRIHVHVKPWPGRLKCLVGHLAENEVRGNLTFIEKALGICEARTLYEAETGKKLSLRGLAAMLESEGLPIHYSSISRLEDAVKYLFPWMSDLLKSGLGTPQIRLLLSLRSEAERVWNEFWLLSEKGELSFTDVFGKCCQKFNSPELWSPDMFRDELIGDLLKALPHPDLNYDRWLMELDPEERLRRNVPGTDTDTCAGDSEGHAPAALPSVMPDADEPEVPGLSSDKAEEGSLRNDNPVGLEASARRTEVQPDKFTGSPVISGGGVADGTSPGATGHDDAGSEASARRTEVQPDKFTGSPVISGGGVADGTSPGATGHDDAGSEVSARRTEVQPDMFGGSPVISGDGGVTDDGSRPDAMGHNDSGEEWLNAMLNPGGRAEDENLLPSGSGENDILSIPAWQDDIGHLQNAAFVLAWEVAEKLGCEDEVFPDRDSEMSAGFSVDALQRSAPAALLHSFTGDAPAHACGLSSLLIGGTAQQDVPVLDDESAHKLLRLMWILRRLRERQRSVTVSGEEDRNEAC
jgi:ParB family protein of integrating conjugative element (PFGI_1 class)